MTNLGISNHTNQEEIIFNLKSIYLILSEVRAHLLCKTVLEVNEWHQNHAKKLNFEELKDRLVSDAIALKLWDIKLSAQRLLDVDNLPVSIKETFKLVELASFSNSLMEGYNRSGRAKVVTYFTEYLYEDYYQIYHSEFGSSV